VWDGDPPRTAAHALHVHASRLRQLVPDRLRIVGRRGGYLLQAAPGQLDTDRFENLTARGRAELASGNPEAAARLLRAALGLWRGPVLADVPWERFAAGYTRRWEELQHAAQEDLVDAELAAGRHADAVAHIEALVHDQPFRERRWGQLMLALYRSGRQADALDRYRQARTLLVNELGIDPSPHLQQLETRILHQDAALTLDGVLGRPATDGDDDVPITRFARGPRGRLAYQVLGEGPRDLVFIPGFGGNVEIRWEQPNLSRLYRRLARSSRLTLLDKLGTGLSDREAGIPPVEDQVDDVFAVMDATGSGQAALFGVTDGGAIALLAAAARPDRVQAVVTYACFSASDLLGPGADQLIAAVRDQIEDGLPLEDALGLLAPSHTGDPAFLPWMARYVRFALGMGGTTQLLENFEHLDIRAALPRVAAPVLALHRHGDLVIPAANADHITSLVPNGRAVILPGRDSAIWAGDVDAIATQVEDFLGTL
jgi:DNA-binding SARP family transcriptional activator/pimeloyl-ACP methyl ester carboxylesterase